MKNIPWSFIILENKLLAKNYLPYIWAITIIKFTEKKKNDIPQFSKCVNFDEFELVKILTDRRSYRIPEKFWRYRLKITLLFLEEKG